MSLKKLLLSISLVLASGSIFSTQTNEPPVLVEHKTWCFKRRGVSGRLPHYIKITNRSNQSVAVDPSFILPDLISYQEIARTLKITDKVLLGSAMFGTLAAGLLAYLMFQDMNDPNVIHNPTTIVPNKRMVFSDTPFFAKLYLAFASIGGLVTASLTYKLLTESQEMLEDELKKEMLHEPITIEPGQYVEKIFWLKNRTDHVTFNFDAVKTIS